MENFNIVYVLIGACIWLPFFIYALTRKPTPEQKIPNPQISKPAVFLVGFVVMLIGVSILILSIGNDVVTLVFKGFPKVIKTEHPVGFYFALMWNLILGFGLVFIAFRYFFTVKIVNEKLNSDLED